MTTKVITARNVNAALSDAIWWLSVSGTQEPSRNGSVLVAPGPVVAEYLRPKERVLFSPLRDANPFFHLMEALWMLTGRDDLAWPMYFNSRFTEYSDDGVSVHGAYGARWRRRLNMDQLDYIVQELQKRPDSRRAVLQMWHATLDLESEGLRDVPCNTHAYFDLRHGELNMTVCCRSNDALWGAYGANAVHFSVLQEYLAARLCVAVGVYRQFSNNLHLYTDVLPLGRAKRIAQECVNYDQYSCAGVRPYRLVHTTAEVWERDLYRFMSDPAGDCAYKEPFFHEVAAPMYAAWRDRKAGTNTGLESARSIAAADWRVACCEWIERRELKMKEQL